MVGIPPIFTSNGETEWFHLYITPAKHAASSNRSIVVSLVIEFEISLVFSGEFVFPSHENGMEESPAFHQYSHLMVRPSGSISILAQPSMPQGRIGALSSPWSSTSRFPWFSQESSFFLLMKMAWKNGRHSANIHV